MTELDPVWVSSDAQLAAAVRAYANASIATKLLGTYGRSMEPGVAYLRGIWMPWMRIPLIFVAQGRLALRGTGCEFVPHQRAPFGWRIRGGNPNLAFRLRPSEIVAVDPADFRSPVARLFDIPFTRVRTTQQGPTRDLLLCVGGRINVPRIRERSLELRRALQTFAANGDPTSV